MTDSGETPVIRPALRRDRAILVAMIGVMTVSLFVMLRAERPATNAAPTVVELAASLRDTPADWVRFSTLSEYALDTTLPRRNQLWRESYRHAQALAPLRTNPVTGFVRGGLFHWYELPDRDRVQVKLAARSILRDPQAFPTIYSSLFNVTGDFDLLARNNPGRVWDLSLLRDLAANTGRFDHYRSLRDDIERKRISDLNAAPESTEPQQLIAMLPSPLGAEHVPLVEALLTRLAARPLVGASPNPDTTSALIDFVIRRHLKPLDGLEAAILEPAAARSTERARLAVEVGNLEAAAQIRAGDAHPASAWKQYSIELAFAQARRGNWPAAEAALLAAAGGRLSDDTLAAAMELARTRGDEARVSMIETQLAREASAREWTGLCGEASVCGTATSTAYFGRPALQLHLRRIGVGGVDPYVEVRIDGRRVVEGGVRDEVWSVPVGTGVHTISITIANPTTSGQRGVRIS
jgi:hypothetical protein